MSKSSVLNLYDAINGSNHFQVKAFSDKVDFSSSTLPLNLKGTHVNLYNADGQTVSDVAGTILAQAASLLQEKSERQAADVSEQAARISGDAAVQSNLDQEVIDRQAAVSAEASARSSADTVLQGKIDDEVSARAAAVSAEASARAGGDATLQFNLDAETTARSSADTTLQVNIDQEVSDRTTAVTAEATARSSADATLQSNIDAERDLRIEDDEVLQTNITNESQARQHFDALEAKARSEADESLSAQIAAEQASRLAEVKVERERIDAILDGTNIDLDQLKELITAYQTSDNNILAQIGAINSSINAIQSQLSNTDDKLNTLIEDVGVAGPSPDYTITSFMMVPPDADHTYLQLQKDGVDLTTQEAVALTGAVVTFDGFAGEITLMGHVAGESGEALVKVSSIHQPIVPGPPTFPINVFVVKYAAYIMDNKNDASGVNQVQFANLDGSGVLSEAQRNAVVGSSFTLGSDSTVYQITQNHNTFNLLTDVFARGPYTGQYVYLV